MIATLNAAANPARFFRRRVTEVAHDDMTADQEGTEELSANTADNDKLNTRLLRIVQDNIVGAGMDG